MHPRRATRAWPPSDWFSPCPSLPSLRKSREKERAGLVHGDDATGRIARTDRTTAADGAPSPLDARTARANACLARPAAHPFDRRRQTGAARSSRFADFRAPPTASRLTTPPPAPKCGAFCRRPRPLRPGRLERPCLRRQRRRPPVLPGRGDRQAAVEVPRRAVGPRSSATSG